MAASVIGRLCLTTALTTAGFWLAPVSSSLAQTSPPVDEGATVQEIVVTAGLREQSLQDVPMAVSAFQGEELERRGAIGYTDLTSFAPNFSYDALTNAGFTTPALRGIGLTGAANSAISNNKATGVYIDGVYLNTAGANLFNVLDVQRVEILRGPQGTLYGRNTIGGVINIVSKEPADDLAIGARGTYGSRDFIQLFGSVSAPIVADVLHARLAGTYISRDGYSKNLFAAPNPNAEESTDDADSLESVAIRGSVSVRPNEELKLLVTVDYAKDRTTYPGYNVEDGASPDLSAFLGPRGASYADTDGSVRKIAYNSRNKERATNWGGSATLEWRRDAWRVVSISGYRKSIYVDDLSDVDGTPVNIYQQWLRLGERSASQELRLHYDTDRLNVVGGLFLYDGAGQQDVLNDILGVERDLGYPLTGGAAPGVLGGSLSRYVAEIDTRSYSAFTNVTFALTDRFSIEAGLRWTSTDVDFARPVNRVEIGGPSNPFYNGDNRFDEVPAGVTFVDLGKTFGEQDRNFTRFTPKVGVNFRPNDDVLLYASWSRGFREGGFATNPSDPSGVGSFGSETLTSYEVGAKLDLFDRRLRLNTAVYHYDYTDQQVELADLAGGALVVDILNSGKSKATGFELEFVARPSRNVELTGNFGYQDTEFKRLNAGIYGDLSGNRFPRAPKVTATLAPAFIFDIPEIGELSFRPDWHYQSSEYLSVLNDPFVRAGARSTFNATLTLEAAKGDWSVALWAKNLTDKTYITQVVDLSSFFGYRLRRYGEPRSVGVTLNYNY